MAWYESIPIIGDIVGTGVDIYNAFTGKKNNEQNVQAQIQANQINQANNEFNQRMATEQFQYQQMQDQRNFQEQQYLNRNSNQIAVADMAKAGLNPLASSGLGSMSSGSGSSVSGNGASTSQISPVLNGSEGLSATSQLASNLQARAQSYKERKSAEKIADAGLDNAKLIAVLQDKNAIAQLISDCISNGVDPSYIANLTSKITDANGITYTGSFDYKGIGGLNTESLKNKFKMEESERIKLGQEAEEYSTRGSHNQQQIDIQNWSKALSGSSDGLKVLIEILKLLK